MYNKVTHLLLTMGINVMRIPLKMFSSSHSLTVGGGKKLMSLPIGTENAIGISIVYSFLLSHEVVM